MVVAGNDEVMDRSKHKNKLWAPHVNVLRNKLKYEIFLAEIQIFGNAHQWVLRISNSNVWYENWTHWILRASEL